MRQVNSALPSRITPEQIDDLSQAVISLTEQLRVLRHAVDEIGDELGWAIRNRVMTVESLESYSKRITSFPIDSAAENFHERVNEVTAADLPEAEASPSQARSSRQQSRLW
jgi:hypothetical protein